MGRHAAKWGVLCLLVLTILGSAQQAGALQFLNTPWAWQPPDIDGNISEGEWDNADLIPAPYSNLRLMRNHRSVFVLVEVYGDTHANEHDQLTLLFDRDKDGTVSQADITYAFEGEGVVRGRPETRGNSQVSETQAVSAKGFGPTEIGEYTSPKHTRPHRFWELRIPADEVAADFDRDTVLTLKSVTSRDPEIRYSDNGSLNNRSQSHAAVLWVVYEPGLSDARISQIEQDHGLERIDVADTGVYRYPVPRGQTAQETVEDVRDAVLFADSPQTSAWSSDTLYVQYTDGASESEIERIETEYRLTRKDDMNPDYILYQIPESRTLADIIALLSREAIFKDFGIEPLLEPTEDLNPQPDFFETSQLDPESEEYRSSRPVALVSDYAPGKVIVHYREGITLDQQAEIESTYSLELDGARYMACNVGSGGNRCRYVIASSQTVREIAQPLTSNAMVRKVGLVLDLRSRCTGFLASSDIIWTATHCFTSPDDARVAAVFNWEAGVSGVQLSDYICHAEHVWESPLDVTLLRCDAGPIGAQEPTKPGSRWGVNRICDQQLAEGDPLYVVHQNDCVGEDCDASEGSATKKISFGIIAALDVPGVEGVPLAHDADTLHGSSGAPVFKPGEHNVVAYHRGYFPDRHVNLAVSIDQLQPELESAGWWDQLNHCED